MLDKDIFIHKVPKGIRYISDWKEFEIFNFPHVLDKQIPGCGFTEYCLTNSENVVLCSPRKILMQNKYDQHSEDVFLVKSGRDKATEVDLNIEKDKLRYTKGLLASLSAISEDSTDWDRFRDGLKRYIKQRVHNKKPIKILVTYDSFRKVKEILDFFNKEVGSLRVVVDEFQSIFTDSKFKSSTELEFVDALQGIDKVCYVSATPMMTSYLSYLDGFKNLPIYTLDWSSEDPDRVQRPIISVRQLTSIKKLSGVLIDPYISGEFIHEYKPDPVTGEVRQFTSKELVIYVNSVDNILSIIKHNKLPSDKVNILCADTEGNQKKVKTLNQDRYNLGKGFEISSCKLKNQDTGKWENGFEIRGIKK